MLIDQAQEKHVCHEPCYFTADCGWAAQGAEDMEADAMLNNYCKADAEKLCADIEPRAGRTQACLMSMVRHLLPPPLPSRPLPRPWPRPQRWHLH